MQSTHSPASPAARGAGDQQWRSKPTWGRALTRKILCICSEAMCIGFLVLRTPSHTYGMR